MIGRSSELSVTKAVRSSSANSSVGTGDVVPAVVEVPAGGLIHWKSWGHKIQRTDEEGPSAVIVAALVGVEDVVQGVLLLAVFPDLVVEMRTGAPTG